MVKLHGEFEKSHGGQQADPGNLAVSPTAAAISGRAIDITPETAQIALDAAASGRLPPDILVAVDKGVVQDGGRVGHEKDMTPEQLQDVIKNGTGRDMPGPSFGLN